MKETAKVYLLAYLPPKEAGWENRVFIHACATTETMSLQKYREMRPDLFEELGHYSLLVSVDRMDVTK